MNVLIWVRNIAVLLLSLLFLIIGINTLSGSYNLKNPLEFIMYFFSASLLILVCIVGIIYFFSRLFIKKQTVDKMFNKLLPINVPYDVILIEKCIQNELKCLTLVNHIVTVNDYNDSETSKII